MIPYSINQLTTLNWSFQKDVEHFARHGVPAITPQRRKLEPYGVDRAVKLMRDAGLKIAAYQTQSPFTLGQPGLWPGEIERFRGQLEVAARLGVDVMIFQVGPRDSLDYDETERRFLTVLEKLVPMAERAGVRIAVEHAHALRMDLGYLSSFHDSVDLADKVDSPYFTVCLETNHAWIERHLYRDIKERTRRIGIVQISDFKAGTTITPARVPLGDGDIPIKRITDAILDAGYAGSFDLELIGPEIEKMGYEEAIRRCQVYLKGLGPKQ